MHHILSKRSKMLFIKEHPKIAFVTFLLTVAALCLPEDVLSEK